MKELCHTATGEGDVGYNTLRMIDLPPSEPDAPLEARWPTLKQGMKVWANGAASGEYARGVMIPWLATDLYSSPSELLRGPEVHGVGKHPSELLRVPPCISNSLSIVTDLPFD
ncbi:hypothetical protein GW17_00048443 [Ensete ventricosum]|nr:hypothetical protein GW17_00048443 [Ensete ventricosum]